MNRRFKTVSKEEYDDLYERYLNLYEENKEQKGEITALDDVNGLLCTDLDNLDTEYTALKKKYQKLEKKHSEVVKAVSVLMNLGCDQSRIGINSAKSDNLENTKTEK